jgi:hypothetical protein
MTDKQQGVYELLSQASPLAAGMINYVQNVVSDGKPGCTDEQTETIRLAFAIGYTTLSKATAKSMHDTLDTVVTIYKHTEVLEDGDEMP